jgi:hypothetical protein
MGAILAAWAPSNPTDERSVPKGVATLFFFEQRAVQDLGVAPLFWTCPGTKEATSMTATAAFKDAGYFRGLCCVRACAACVLVSMQALAARPT